MSTTGRLLGYVDKLSAPPGGDVHFKLSQSPAAPASVRVVRLQSGLPEPFGPGEKLHDVEGSTTHRIEIPSQPLRPGSYGTAPASTDNETVRAFTVAVWVWPTLFGGERLAPSVDWTYDVDAITTIGVGDSQGIVARRSDIENAAGYSLFLDSHGAPTLHIFDGAGTEASVTGDSLPRNTWTLVVARFDAEDGLRLDTRVRGPWSEARHGAAGTEWTGAKALRLDPGNVVFAALGARTPTAPPDSPFSGKLDAPTIWHSSLTDTEIAEMVGDLPPRNVSPQSLWGAWDFSTGIESFRFEDVSGAGRHGRLINSPTRAVTGFNWLGDEEDFRRAPATYGAVHFHPDDVADAEWTTTFTWSIPTGTTSGIYAAEVTTDQERELVWFVVEPTPEKTTAKVAVLLPTLTYLAYANNQLPYPDVADRGDGFERRRDPRQAYIDAHPELGRSLYDFHSDGSGVSCVSRYRPLVDNAPDFVTDFLHAGRHFAADLYLVDWLMEQEIDFDVVTDHSLHEHGAGLLQPYRVVVTGSHPEYVTGAILDALRDFGIEGGNLMYLGGNGFYWVSSLAGDGLHLMECRRGQFGSGTWKSAAGEVHHSTTGEFGGLWRYRGKSEHELALVGFASAGSGSACKPFVRQPESHKPEVAFVFEGITEDEVIGDFGYALGAAGGDEIDRVDKSKGSPSDALLLASATGFDRDDYAISPEDIIQRPDMTRHDQLVRADMAIALREKRGAVFAVGSMTWTASLAHNGYDNNVSRVTQNVLTRFMSGGCHGTKD